MFFGYLGREYPGVERHYDRALEAVSHEPMKPSLYNGFVGVAWVGAHLDVLDPLDETLDNALATAFAEAGASRWPEFDLMDGLAGMLVQIRERLPRPIATQNAARIVTELDARLADSWAREGSRTLLGVAHGIMGIAAAVAHASVGTAGERLAQVAIRTVLGRLPTLAPAPQFGWCHADIGIAAALLGAARTLGDADLERTAVRIAAEAATRHRDDGVVRDASFCHGAAGLGHLFNRIFQASGDERCGEAACYWFARALELRREGTGIGGYRAWLPGEKGAMAWCDEAGLLHGAAGVALALLAAASDGEPRWDRAFALS